MPSTPRARTPSTGLAATHHSASSTSHQSRPPSQPPHGSIHPAHRRSSSLNTKTKWIIVVDTLRARRSMTRALDLEPENPFVLSACSEAALYSAGDIDRAATMLESAMRRDPNDANALALLGNVRRMAGDDPHAGLTLIDQAMRLSPRDPR